jgi:ribosomal protein L13E
MWDKNDWHQFFEIANKPMRRRRPPRPVYPSGAKRVLPAIGFSLSELDDAGINMEAAEQLGLPVDVARIGAYGPNVSALREYIRSARPTGKIG